MASQHEKAARKLDRRRAQHDAMKLTDEQQRAHKRPGSLNRRKQG